MGSHLIEKQIFQVNYLDRVNQDEIQYKLKGEIQSKVLEALERLFDEYFPGEDLIEFESIKLDLGVIDASKIDDDFVGRLELLLRQELQKIRYEVDSQRKDVPLKTISHSKWEMWKHFITTGVVPIDIGTEDFNAHELFTSWASERPHELRTFLQKTTKRKGGLFRIVNQLSADSILSFIDGFFPDYGSRLASFDVTMSSLVRRVGQVYGPMSLVQQQKLRAFILLAIALNHDRSSSQQLTKREWTQLLSRYKSGIIDIVGFGARTSGAVNEVLFRSNTYSSKDAIRESKVSLGAVSEISSSIELRIAVKSLVNEWLDGASIAAKSFSQNWSSRVGEIWLRAVPRSKKEDFVKEVLRSNVNPFWRERAELLMGLKSVIQRNFRIDLFSFAGVDRFMATLFDEKKSLEEVIEEFVRMLTLAQDRGQLSESRLMRFMTGEQQLEVLSMPKREQVTRFWDDVSDQMTSQPAGFSGPKSELEALLYFLEYGLLWATLPSGKELGGVVRLFAELKDKRPDILLDSIWKKMDLFLVRHRLANQLPIEDLVFLTKFMVGNHRKGEPRLIKIIESWYDIVDAGVPSTVWRPWFNHFLELIWVSNEDEAHFARFFDSISGVMDGEAWQGFSQARLIWENLASELNQYFDPDETGEQRTEDLPLETWSQDNSQWIHVLEDWPTKEQDGFETFAAQVAAWLKTGMFKSLAKKDLHAFAAKMESDESSPQLRQRALRLVNPRVFGVFSLLTKWVNELSTEHVSNWIEDNVLKLLLTKSLLDEKVDDRVLENPLYLAWISFSFSKNYSVLKDKYEALQSETNLESGIDESFKNELSDVLAFSSERSGFARKLRADLKLTRSEDRLADEWIRIQKESSKQNETWFSADRPKEELKGTTKDDGRDDTRDDAKDDEHGALNKVSVILSEWSDPTTSSIIENWLDTSLPQWGRSFTSSIELIASLSSVRLLQLSLAHGIDKLKVLMIGLSDRGVISKEFSVVWLLNQEGGSSAVLDKLSDKDYDQLFAKALDLVDDTQRLELVFEQREFVPISKSRFAESIKRHPHRFTELTTTVLQSRKVTLKKPWKQLFESVADSQHESPTESGQKVPSTLTSDSELLMVLLKDSKDSDYLRIVIDHDLLFHHFVQVYSIVRVGLYLKPSSEEESTISGYFFGIELLDEFKKSLGQLKLAGTKIQRLSKTQIQQVITVLIQSVFGAKTTTATSPHLLVKKSSKAIQKRFDEQLVQSIKLPAELLRLVQAEVDKLIKHKIDGLTDQSGLSIESDLYLTETVFSWPRSLMTETPIRAAGDAWTTMNYAEQTQFVLRSYLQGEFSFAGRVLVQDWMSDQVKSGTIAIVNDLVQSFSKVVTVTERYAEGHDLIMEAVGESGLIDFYSKSKPGIVGIKYLEFVQRIAHLKQDYRHALRHISVPRLKMLPLVSKSATEMYRQITAELIMIFRTLSPVLVFNGLHVDKSSRSIPNKEVKQDSSIKVGSNGHLILISRLKEIVVGSPWASQHYRLFHTELEQEIREQKPTIEIDKDPLLWTVIRTWLKEGLGGTETKSPFEIKQSLKRLLASKPQKTIDKLSLSSINGQAVSRVLMVISRRELLDIISNLKSVPQNEVKTVLEFSSLLEHRGLPELPRSVIIRANNKLDEALVRLVFVKQKPDAQALLLELMNDPSFELFPYINEALQLDFEVLHKGLVGIREKILEKEKRTKEESEVLPQLIAALAYIKDEQVVWWAGSKKAQTKSSWRKLWGQVDKDVKSRSWLVNELKFDRSLLSKLVKTMPEEALSELILLVDSQKGGFVISLNVLLNEVEKSNLVGQISKEKSGKVRQQIIHELLHQPSISALRLLSLLISETSKVSGVDFDKTVSAFVQIAEVRSRAGESRFDPIVELLRDLTQDSVEFDTHGIDPYLEWKQEGDIADDSITAESGVERDVISYQMDQSFEAALESFYTKRMIPATNVWSRVDKVTFDSKLMAWLSGGSASAVDKLDVLFSDKALFIKLSKQHDFSFIHKLVSGFLGKWNEFVSNLLIVISELPEVKQKTGYKGLFIWLIPDLIELKRRQSLDIVAKESVVHLIVTKIMSRFEMSYEQLHDAVDKLERQDLSFKWMRISEVIKEFPAFKEQLKREKENKRETIATKKEELEDLPPAPKLVEGVEIQNAGLVLLSPYLKPYLDRLGLIDGAQFKSQEDAIRGAGALQYLATGNVDALEHEMLMNKVICGIPINVPLPQTVSMSEADKELADGLLKAVLQNWDKMNNSSVEALRETFLLREGRLVERDKVWELQVEKKTLDILLDSLSWTYGMIKLPWMEKRLVVIWE